MKFLSLWEMMRPKQWVKNLFIFVPLIFSGNLLNMRMVAYAMIAFLAFSLMASCVYIINDLCDAKGDRQHPVKCKRPIASGRVSSRTAIYMAVILALISCVCIVISSLDLKALAILLGYLLLNICYSLKLKDIAILDVMIIAFGFLLRVLMGGVAIGVPVTAWLVIMVFLLTLLIGFGKRRDDLLRMERDHLEVRKSVRGYSLQFVDIVMGILSATMLMAYVAYTLTPEVMERFNSQYVYLTTIFVVAAVIRYLQMAFVKEQTGSPTDLFYHDHFLQTCCILWALSFLIIIY
jgi:4-hydroxybenzoate polyprenyltransferase